MGEWMPTLMLRQAGLSLLAAGALLTGLSCGGESIAPPTTGSLEITTATSGPSPDEDGYTITIDGTDHGTLGTSAGVSIDGLAPGEHVVGLGGVAGNCGVEGENPRSVTVTAGASATAAFAVVCTTPPPVTATLRIVTATSGPDQDPDGYAFAVDGGTSQPIGVSATTTLTNVAAGAHTVSLSDLTGNCTVQGTNPRSVTVSAGATADVSFAVSCTTATGSLQITTTTSGNAPDLDGYTVTVDNAAARTIAATASLTVPALSPGTHRVTLGGLATNCRLVGDNPRSVTVTAGATATVTFSITCPMSQIAFTSHRDGNPEIYVMNADGSGLTRLTSNSDNDGDPAWSPDGTQIAFVRNRDIYVMNADGSGQTSLTSGPAEDYQPTWSPDATKIAFIRDSDPSDPENFRVRAIMVMNRDGTGLAQLTAVEYFRNYYRSADWSRDGSRIAFAAWFEDEPSSIWIMNADGSGNTRIFGGTGTNAQFPAWSTGGRIAFSCQPYDAGETGGIILLEDSEICVMNADGTGVIQLTNNSEEDLHPAWSRDDRKIAFTRYRDGNRDIYVMNPDGSGQTRLTNHPERDSEPTWSP